MNNSCSQQKWKLFVFLFFIALFSEKYKKEIEDIFDKPRS